MFTRILIANRGEIACRIIATCHRLGISTVAVHSDADAMAKHVSMADMSVRIGPPPAAESYLDQAAILAAARATGAEAIHPGYGFLSENPDFVEAVVAAGLTFIGPSAAAIRTMGLKDAAKTVMAKAGVPVVPGYHGANQDDAHLAEQAALIGYPVLIKAVAGGGGKGMRRVAHPRDFAHALTAARAEARAAFGNTDVLVEKWIAAPRHIEMQVFGDSHGNAVHLFERDCSLQRRHQKVIEEAPAPGMTPAMRAAMGAAAVQAARAIDYCGAGTVEFIVDGARGLHPDGFWFMEMNTRLQVEHPVTEAVTGEDLVEWQLRVAAGAPLPKTQDDIRLQGHAIEARVYAENPANGFLPATGRLGQFDVPSGVRIDTGVRSGDEISSWYDPMIAKIIAHGPTRTDALAILGRGLADTRIAGSVTNLGFLGRLLRHPDFVLGTFDTGLIEGNVDALVAEPEPDPGCIAAAALVLSGLAPPEGVCQDFTGFTLWEPLVRPIVLLSGAERIRIDLEVIGPDLMRIDGVDFRIADSGPTALFLRREKLGIRYGLARDGDAVTVFHEGTGHFFRRADRLDIGDEAYAAADDIRAPMPGLVRRIATAEGVRVARGDVLLVLEAMKMEHALIAPRDGIVAVLDVTEGAQVVEGARLLALETEGG